MLSIGGKTSQPAAFSWISRLFPAQHPNLRAPERLRLAFVALEHQIRGLKAMLSHEKTFLVIKEEDVPGRFRQVGDFELDRVDGTY